MLARAGRLSASREIAPSYRTSFSVVASLLRVVEEEDSAMIRFVIGALIAAGWIWFWMDRTREFADGNMSNDRKSAAGNPKSPVPKAARRPGRTTERVGSATRPGQEEARG